MPERAADDLVSEADADDAHAGLFEDEVADETDEAVDPRGVFVGAVACGCCDARGGRGS